MLASWRSAAPTTSSCSPLSDSGGEREHLGAQAPPAAVLEAVDGVLGAADALGDLARREADEEAQDDHVALLGGERGERDPQVGEALAAGGAVVGHVGRAYLL